MFKITQIKETISSFFLFHLPNLRHLRITSCLLPAILFPRHRDRLNAIELKPQLLPLFPRQEFRQRPGFFQGHIHTRDVATCGRNRGSRIALPEQPALRNESVMPQCNETLAMLFIVLVNTDM
jgi:hypothetical protein